MNTKKPLFSKQASYWFRGLSAIMIVLSHYAEWWAWFTPTEGLAEIFRQALTNFSVYGVSAFFLFSGYGIIKSLNGSKMTLQFVLKKLLSVYVPYLIISCTIELWAGGFATFHDFWEVLYGHDFWFMCVLFLFYLGFICIWAIISNTHLRCILFSCYVFFISFILFYKGMHAFWFVSNSAFLLGLLSAVYEEPIKALVDKSRKICLPVFSVAMLYIAYSGLFKDLASFTDDEHALMQFVATIIWTLFVLYTASGWNRYEPVLMGLGKHSLYIYLTHTFIFMRCVNYFPYSYFVRFLLAAIITVIISIIANMLISIPLKQLLKRS